MQQARHSQRTVSQGGCKVILSLNFILRESIVLGKSMWLGSLNPCTNASFHSSVHHVLLVS